MNSTYKLAAAGASYITDDSSNLSFFSALLEKNATVRYYDVLYCELNLNRFEIIILSLF